MGKPKLRDVLREHFPTDFMVCRCDFVGPEEDWAFHVEMAWKQKIEEYESRSEAPKPKALAAVDPRLTDNTPYEPEPRKTKIMLPPIPGK